MKGKRANYLGVALCCTAAALSIQGCGNSSADGKVEIEIVQYKPEAAISRQWKRNSMPPTTTFT